ncbi:arginine N-methyltransferase skb1 [Myriangium duriaei CBS 260.36]|uniref:Protein arginine N-methyltransferase n=1 Tax=Myriangium duriaei CBS 260.36 TaxID=1168546 RepID=A0A9P4J0F0_9PEZI|nr:arginine N-methyltransferase skb1 [Myriangium duriaei CBS 260.36]
MTSQDGPGMATPVFYIGLHDIHRKDPITSDDIDLSYNTGYDMITTPITNNAFREHAASVVSNPAGSLISCLSTEYTSLTPTVSTPSMIGLVSPWVDVASKNPRVAHLSRQVLSMEVAYAAFCGISNVVLPPLFRGKDVPDHSAVSRYASAVASATTIGPYLQLLVPFPMDDQPIYPESTFTHSLSASIEDVRGDTTNASDPLSPWDAWNFVRSTCNYHAKLAIALNLPRLLPSEQVQSRWYSEPLRLLHLPTQSFAPNPKGHPVLSKAHQALLTRYMRLQQVPWLLLSGTESLQNSAAAQADPTPAEAANVPIEQVSSSSHLAYLRYFQMNQPPLPPLARFAQGYQDYLQSPLQPLTDNLESITYEVFEKDPIKYEWYEKAVALALQDLYAELQRPIVLAVVGAGRGPLMTRSLLASASTKVPIVPYAVEKNPNAFVLLQNRNAIDPLWDNRVTLIKSDMRSWSGPVVSSQPAKIDIMVSELLGSFADNELSPECLDGAQHLLHPSHGVSIPQSYTAWVTPIASPRIHSDLVHRPSSDIHKYDLPYVAMLHQYAFLSFSSEPLPPGPGGLLAYPPAIKQCWEFAHPLPPPVITASEARRTANPSAPGLDGGDGWNEHNVRRCELVFPITTRGVCHGLAGYFETVLYKPRDASVTAVELSTNPNSMDEKSRDMISWFPIYFPLKTPVYVPDGGEVEVVMERRTDDRKVWYTWQVVVWVEIGGVRQRVGVSEVGSSKENGCLM